MKKQTKSSKTKTKKVTSAPAAKQVVVVHSRRQKFFGFLAFAGLFACGLFVGMSMNTNGVTKQKQIAMTESQCASLASSIINAADGFCGNVGIGVDCTAKAKDLNDIYTANCAGRIVVVQEKTKQSQPKENNADSEERFKSLSTCEQIETLLLERLTPKYETYSGNHIVNAQTYASLSERGCPENSEKYKKLAEQELQVARALEDDYLDEMETKQIVETYKRIQMRQQAQQVLDTVKKLTNPAIDFIIEVEKIINE